MYSGLNPFIDPLESKPKVAPGLALQEVEGGFPHSEILGSKLVRSSPRLIAAYHVLHRLSAPRHPPNALASLDHSHDRCPPPTREAGPKNDRRQDSAPCQRSERPAFGSCNPKTFACLMHPVAQPCGAALVHPNRSLEQPGSTACITSLQCQTSAIAPRAKAPRNHRESQKSQPDTPKGRSPRANSPKTQARPKQDPSKTQARPKQDPSKTQEWWSQTGSNRRSEACKATALPTELWPP